MIEKKENQELDTYIRENDCEEEDETSHCRDHQSISVGQEQ